MASFNRSIIHSFKTLLLLLFLLFSGQILLAQSADTTVQIPEILITDSRLPLSGIGSKQERFDSLILHSFRNTNLAEALLLNSQSYIRSYGPGRLATSSIRGAASVHTAVLWNGFNLQSPILGLSDLALFPISFVDAVRVEYGGGTALWGNGALGGVVHLNSEPHFGKDWNAQLQSNVGSFGLFSNSGRLDFSNESFHTTTRIFQQSAKNDFPYKDLNDNEQDLINAEVQQFGVLHEDFIRLSANQELGVHVWWQESERELPPSMAFNNPDASQEDRILRLAADWKRIGSKLNLYARAGAFREQLNYNDPDPAFAYFSEDVFWTAISEVEGKLHLNANQELNIGINNTWTEVNSPTLPELKRQNRTAFFAAYHLNNHASTLRTVLSARQEVVEGDLIPFVPSLGVEFDIVKDFTIKVAVSRNYRLPTFGDLYSTFGSDPNLQPESGWSEELGLVYKKIADAWSLEFSVTGFNRNIENWIVYLPDSSGFVYTPRNVLEVHSRGIENVFEIGFRAGESQFTFIGKYDFVKSTNEKVAPENPGGLGKHLVYIPKHKALAQFIWRKSGWEATYRHSFVDKVFIDERNSRELSGFSIGDLSVSRAFDLNKIQLSAFAKVHNIWNENYQMVAFYPMPGRNMEVGIGVRY
ncbi:MAG: TonB-dependent receptor [Saprospiraceae bacterium]|nr:TonB-dependent receptor [Saprospiraceae bacterium]